MSAGRARRARLRLGAHPCGGRDKKQTVPWSGILKKAFEVFRRDLRRIFRSPVALVVVIGIAVVPCLYAWINVLANWDPYENTSDVPVAVVNQDKAVTLESTGSVCAGDLMVDALKENTQIGWRFTDEDEALEGVRSGRYYAAIVIPNDFTSHLTGVLSGNTEKAKLKYYVNEKVNPIAPKVTDAGASTIESQIDSKYIATYDSLKNVDGQFMKVRNTPFDFMSKKHLKAIGTDIDIFDEQMRITKGYDHAFALRHAGQIDKPAAVVYDEKSGRALIVYTTEPALHVYTANGLNGSLVGKNGVAYPKQSAICLETMHFADSPNHEEFPSTVLRPGETYRSQTTYQFSGYTHKKRNLQSSILMYGGVASLTGLGVFGVISLTK